MTSQQTVYVVDDDANSRSLVEALVGEMGVYSQSFASAEAFLESYDGKSRGCLVAEVRLGAISGLALQQELAKREWWLPTLIITAYADVSLTVRAMRNCALAVLEKPWRQHELWEAIREALRIDRENHQVHSRTCETQDRLEQLSPGERDVLDLILNGVSNKFIARQLGFSVRTIETRRHNIFEKMHVDSVAGLVQQVVEARILQQRFRHCPKGALVSTSSHLHSS